jgi:hypothetical protein
MIFFRITPSACDRLAPLLPLKLELPGAYAGGSVDRERQGVSGLDFAGSAAAGVRCRRITALG